MKTILKNLLLAVSFLTSLSASAANNNVAPDCTFKGKKLYGNIKVVKSFPDVKVKVVSAFPDLNVKRVSAFPDSCGKWKMVESFPDTKIQYVDSFPDVKIKFVDNFPGRAH